MTLAPDTPPRIVILGALSAMAVEIARRYAGRGADFGLLARSEERLDDLAKDLRVRGAGRVETMAIDLADAPFPDAVLGELAARLGGIDILILAYGILGEMPRAEEDLAAATAILNTDFTSAVLWLLAAAKRVSQKGSIVVFASVAGDRGRKSNYIYGAAKAGLAVFAEGLAHRVAGTGPHILVVKPGFTATPMTAGMAAKGPFATSAQEVARIVVDAIDRKRGPVIYAPRLLRGVMFAVRLVPAAIFHRTDL